MKFTRIYNVICALAVTVLFASCADIQESKTTASEKNAYVVSGTVSVGGTSGALPSAYLATVTDFAVRSATSSLSQITGSRWGEFTVTAKQGDRVVQGTVSESDNAKAYQIELPLRGEWKLTVAQDFYYETSEEKEVLWSVTETVTIQESEQELTKNIVLYPVLYPDDFEKSVSGSIDLRMTVPASVTSVEYSSKECDAENAPIISGSATVSDEKATITSADVPVGIYEVTFVFKDRTGNSVYACTEAITVFGHFVTDTWYGDSAYMQKDTETGAYTFVLTEAALSSYGQVDTLSDSDYPIILWNKAETSETDGRTEWQKGYNIFTEIVENQKIGDGKTLGSENIKDFCIDAKTQKIYALEKDSADVMSIVKYPSYAGYAWGKTLYTAPADTQIYSFTVYNDTLWFTTPADAGTNVSYALYRLENGKPVHYMLTASSDNDLPFTSAPLLASDDEYVYTLTCTTATDGGTFVAGADIVVRKCAISHDEKTLTQVAEYSTTAATLKLAAEDTTADTTAEAQKVCSNFKATDFILSNDGSALYALVSDLNGTHSRGGLIKFGISVSGDTHRIDIDSIDDDDVYGWYSENYCAPAVADGQSTDTTAITDEQKAAAKKCFYGPQKFIARKPDELYIADEGSYDYDTNKNRVVKLNLEDLSATTIVDVDVSFNSCKNSGFYEYE